MLSVPAHARWESIFPGGGIFPFFFFSSVLYFVIHMQIGFNEMMKSINFSGVYYRAAYVCITVLLVASWIYFYIPSSRHYIKIINLIKAPPPPPPPCLCPRRLAFDGRNLSKMFVEKVIFEAGKYAFFFRNAFREIASPLEAIRESRRNAQLCRIILQAGAKCKIKRPKYRVLCKYISREL